MKNYSLLAIFALIFLCGIKVSNQASFIPLPHMKRTSDSSVKVESGGYNCVLCTVLVSQSIVAAAANSEAVDVFIEKDLCRIFKAPLKQLCVSFVANYGAVIINALKNNASPDEACREAKLCDNPKCNLYPHKKFSMTFSENWDPLFDEDIILSGIHGFTFDPWQELLKILENFSNNHRPDIDLDNDTFSAVTAQVRGFHWKGKDCNDANTKIYPGRKVNPTKDPTVDYNCNGIYGKDNKTQVDWKTKLCGNSSQMGYAVIGDSAGAHFSLPASWFNGSEWKEGTFDDFATRGLDEFDLPHYSGWTGYINDSAAIPSRSIYQYLYQRNKCNFRDFQNAGINGADSYKEIEYIKQAFKRDQQNDYPMLVFLELIGNDVCSGGYHMTNVTNFKQNILTILDYLDTVLPAGSHVVTVGVADGRVLYDNLHNRTHPLGVTYAEFYDYLMCLGKNPCVGWLNSNETTRNLTSERAANLSQVYRDILASGKTYKNFDWTYYDFPATTIINNWKAQGKDPALLIEPVDGFHPGQQFNALMADYFWQALLRDKPEWLGPVNPNNDLITQLFGNQGGYGTHDS